MHDDVDPTLVVVSTARLSVPDLQLAAFALLGPAELDEKTQAELHPVAAFYRSIGMQLWAEAERRGSCQPGMA